MLSHFHLTLTKEKRLKMSVLQYNQESLIKLINYDIDAYLKQFKASEYKDTFYSEILDAYLYPLKAGGKRIRPLLCLLIAGAIGGKEAIEKARNAALAIEKIHTYSLVHDDLPCMDNDDFRRGQPTTHKKYGEAKALLIGDALLTQSFSLLAQISFSNKHYNYLAYLIEDLTEGAGLFGMIQGQWLDISFTGNHDASWQQIETVHKNKTGKLIGASLSLGLICGISTLNNLIKEDEFIELRKTIKSIGIAIGLSFQIMDDILDSTQSQLELGKTARKDIVQNKRTAMSILGADKSKEISDSYTNNAISMLLSLFQSSFLKKNTDETMYFQEMMIEKIKELLTRTN